MKKEQKNIFGNKSEFAIEAILWQIDEHPIFINYCLWIRYNMVGDIEQCALLSAEMERIFKVVQLKGQRQMPFENLSASVLTDKLIENTWGNASDYNQNVTLTNIDILSQHGECFQGYYVFLIEQQGYEWLLTKDNVDNKYYDVKIPSDIIYSTDIKLSHNNEMIAFYHGKDLKVCTFPDMNILANFSNIDYGRVSFSPDDNEILIASHKGFIYKLN